MPNNINEKEPWSKNQITSSKPNIPKTTSILTGHIANSMNAGHNKVIAWKRVMAGERHQSYNVDMHVKVLTPKTPPYQNLKMTIRTYFVPDSRVWDNAEAYTAQKGGASEIKIKERPNLFGKIVPGMLSDDNLTATNLMNTDVWEKLPISSYIPRIAEFRLEDGENSDELLQRAEIRLPKIDALPLRGRIAIYNDFERNKELDEEYEEFKTDEITQYEWIKYLQGERDNTTSIEMTRAKKPNSYYTDVRMELQGFEEALPEPSSDVALLNWMDFEAKAAESRSQAEDSQLNTWDVIAKIRGSKKLTEGKVQLIGERTFTLNYATITQSSYNIANVEPEYQVMGTQGAYSYTNIKTDLYGGMIFNEEGYIHVIATVYAETVFEKGIDRNQLNVNALDEYRPDLKDEKKDVLYRKEIEPRAYDDESIVGFKRRFSEIFKLPNIIGGDMSTDNILESDENNSRFSNQRESNNTFQLYESSASYYQDKRTGESFPLKWWKDYSDVILNKNLAIKNRVEWINQEMNTIIVKGPEQIFFVGKAICLCDLPVSEEIKNNFTKWGEH